MNPALFYRFIFVQLILGSFFFSALSAQSPAKVLEPHQLQSEVTFSREGGTYTDSFSLTLSADAGLRIRYTFDNSELSLQNGISYSNPISISNTQIIRAKAFDESGNVSPSVSQTYIKVADDLKDFDSNLPIMIINSFGAQKAWIANYMSEFEEALYRSNFTDSEEGYAKYIDENSFID